MNTLLAVLSGSLFATILPVQLVAAWEQELGHPLSVEIDSMETGLEEFTWDIVWDRDGVAYLAREQIWRWDGTQLDPVGPDIFSEMHAIAMDRADRILVGGINEFGIYDPRTDTYESLMERLPPEQRQFGRAWAIHDDGEAIWMGSNSRLFRIGPKTTQVHQFEAKHRVVFHFLESGVYAHEPTVGLWKVVGNELHLLSENSELNRNALLFLEDQSDGNLLAISSAGSFLILDDKEAQIDHVVLPSLSNAYISAVERIDSERVLIGTLGDGLYILSGRSEVSELLLGDIDVSEAYTVAICLTPNGDVFLAQNSGTNLLLTDLSLGLLNTGAEFSFGLLNAVSKIGKTLFLASNSGQFYSFSGNLSAGFEKLSSAPSRIIENSEIGPVFSEYNKLNLFSSSTLRTLREFDREIWTFTTVGERLIVGFSDRLEVYRLDEDGELDQLWEYELPWGLRVLKADASGTLWGWDPLGPLLELKWEETGGFLEVRHEVIGGLSLREQRHGFAMTTEGPVLLIGDQIGRYRRQAGGWEVAALEKPGGALEASTFHYKADMLEGWLVSWDSELKSHLLTEVTWEPGGQPSIRRLPWIDMRELGRIKTIALFEDGDTQRLLISGLKGVLWADRGLTDQIPAPARPVVFQGERRLWDSPRIEADYGDPVLNFRYSSPGSGTYYPVRYQTRLSGRDDAWSEPSSLPFRELGQLWEGRYTLEVRAVDPFGRASPVTTVGLRVRPPFWRTPVAGLLYLSALLVAGYLFYLFKSRKLRRRQAWLEGEVKARTRELERANQFKDDFIANLSHEIRNPLNGVIGSIRQLKPEEALPGRTLTSLLGAAHYLQTTVEEVLDFAKLESGEILLEESAFDLSEVVGGILEIHHPAALGKGLSLTTRIRIPEGIAVVSDTRKIQQIIGNLVGNAVKFTETGKVTVGVILKPEDTENAALRIWVEDTGPGIPGPEKGRIFEKFYQGKGGTLKTAGTGIGLALVKTYVERLGGRVELESEPGKGSTFVVNLRVGLQPLPEAETRPPDGKAYDGIRILIVEDLEYNRTVLEDFLGDLGCVTESADNGRDGFEKARAGNFAIILLDWELPEKSGLEVARELRADPRFPRDTLIVGMTAYATAEDQQACLDAGMDVFLSKPISHRNLLEVLDRVAGSGAVFQGPGLVSEMTGETGLHETLERWAGFHVTYRKELEAAIEGADMEAIRKAAHRFLGHLRMLELARLPGVVADLMTAAQAGDLGGVAQEWKVVVPLMEQLERELRERIQSFS